MQLSAIEVSNFRALRSANLRFASTTALLGENNSGKSAFLAALDLFFSNAPKVTDRDFSDGNLDVPIDITVHFHNFTPAELTEFGSNLLDGRLIVTRRLSMNSSESGRFFVSAKVNPDFSDCRNETGKTEKRAAYKKLQESYELENVTNADDIPGRLEQWEANNPDKLSLQLVSGFKGWKNVAVGKLKEHTDYIFLRAVQDAAESIGDSKSSPVKTLVNVVARQTIENNPAYQGFMKDANSQIAEFTDPKKVPALQTISTGLTDILQGYYKDASIIASWNPIEAINPAFPTSEIEVRSNDFVSKIDGVGHGLQRAIILTVLQFMAHQRATISADQEFSEAQSDLIIAIEEPEIYQHPIKQRLFSRVLSALAKGFNKSSGIRIQIIFVTHSPLLVSLPRCEEIRLVRHRSTDPRSVIVSEISLESCAETLALANQTPKGHAFNKQQMLSKLHTFKGELAEGFFARCVVLTEGVGDKALLEAWYLNKNRDPHSEGIVVAEVSGKDNLPKAVTVFSQLKIPCYVVFDNDEAKNQPKANRALQFLAGVPVDKCVDFPEGVFPRFAAWKGRLETYVEARTGGDFPKHIAEVSAAFEVGSSDCLKTPSASAALFVKLVSQGITFPELDAIERHIDALCSAH